ncbi:MAG: CopG family transcriptional regulator [Candidatus Geothermarchaeales archaeon]
MAERKKEYLPILLPKKLLERIRARVEKTKEFSTVEEYITYVLEEVFSELEGGKEQRVFTKEEEEEVKSRLKALGYL